MGQGSAGGTRVVKHYPLSTKLTCTETRKSEAGTARRYRCACGLRVKTIETVELVYDDSYVLAMRQEHTREISNLRNLK